MTTDSENGMPDINFILGDLEPSRHGILALRDSEQTIDSKIHGDTYFAQYPSSSVLLENRGLYHIRAPDSTVIVEMVFQNIGNSPVSVQISGYEPGNSTPFDFGVVNIPAGAQVTIKKYGSWVLIAIGVLAVGGAVAVSAYLIWKSTKGPYRPSGPRSVLGEFLDNIKDDMQASTRWPNSDPSQTDHPKAFGPSPQDPKRRETRIIGGHKWEWDPITAAWTPVG